MQTGMVYNVKTTTTTTMHSIICIRVSISIDLRREVFSQTRTQDSNMPTATETSRLRRATVAPAINIIRPGPRNIYFLTATFLTFLSYTNECMCVTHRGPCAADVSSEQAGGRMCVYETHKQGREQRAAAGSGVLQAAGKKEEREVPKV